MSEERKRFIEKEYSFSLIGSLPSPFATQILYKPYTSLPCHFSPEDGDSVFLQNVGMSLQHHMVPKPKTTSTL
jgi:hypothetical protein